METGDDDAGGLGVAPLSRVDLVERHWRGLAAMGQVPHRRELRAAELGEALAQSFTLEQVAPGVARLRVAGQRLHDWFGADPRGVPLSALFDESGRPGLRDALAILFTRPALVEVPLLTPRGAFRMPVAGRLLLMPLRGDDGTVTRALGSIGLAEAPLTGPRRFGVPTDAAMRVEPLERPRKAPAPATFAEPALARVPELAERGVPWLRLVVSND